MMKDKEMRGLVLQKFYDLRHTQDVVGLNDVASVAPDDFNRVANLAEQLAEYNLIRWNTSRALGGAIAGLGKITARGVDVVDGDVASPIAITLHDHSVKITKSSGVIIGSGNVQHVHIDVGKINTAIDSSNVSEGEKKEAKSLLEKVVSNKVLWAVLGTFFASGAQ